MILNEQSVITNPATSELIRVPKYFGLATTLMPSLVLHTTTHTTHPGRVRADVRTARQCLPQPSRASHRSRLRPSARRSRRRPSELRSARVRVRPVPLGRHTRRTSRSVGRRRALTRSQNNPRARSSVVTPSGTRSGCETTRRVTPPERVGSERTRSVSATQADDRPHSRCPRAEVVGLVMVGTWVTFSLGSFRARLPLCLRCWCCRELARTSRSAAWIERRSQSRCKAAEG